MCQGPMNYKINKMSKKQKQKKTKTVSIQKTKSGFKLMFNTNEI